MCVCVCKKKQEQMQNVIRCDKITDKLLFKIGKFG